MPAHKKPPGTQRSKAQNSEATTLNIPCLAKEKASWKSTAEDKGLATAAWARSVLNAAAKRRKYDKRDQRPEQ